MEENDAPIRKFLDDVWLEYNKHGSSSLDKEETEKFLNKYLPYLSEEGEFSEAEFEAIFKEIDKDGSGTIEKDELAIFMQKF